MVPAAVSRKKGRLNKESLIGRELSFKSETLHQQSCAATTRRPPAGGANAKHSGSPQRRFPFGPPSTTRLLIAPSLHSSCGIRGLVTAGTIKAPASPELPSLSLPKPLFRDQIPPTLPISVDLDRSQGNKHNPGEELHFD